VTAARICRRNIDLNVLCGALPPRCGLLHIGDRQVNAPASLPPAAALTPEKSTSTDSGYVAVLGSGR
jgi:hypothetical protein